MDRWKRARQKGRKCLGKQYVSLTFVKVFVLLTFSRRCFGSQSGCLAIKHVSTVLMDMDFRASLHYYYLLIIVALSFLVGIGIIML